MVIDEARQVSSEGDDFVEFVTAGAPATGAFRCSACGYGVTVSATLPRCPMCSGTTWERPSLGGFAPSRRE